MTFAPSTPSWVEGVDRLRVDGIFFWRSVHGVEPFVARVFRGGVEMVKSRVSGRPFTILPKKNIPP